MYDKLIEQAVEFLSSKSTSNPFQTAKDSLSEAQYNDDDHYAIHPDTGKVMDSWSKRDSRVNAVMSQQHKDKGHIIKTGRELNYAEYSKSKS